MEMQVLTLYFLLLLPLVAALVPTPILLPEAQVVRVEVLDEMLVGKLVVLGLLFRGMLAVQVTMVFLFVAVAVAEQTN
jgi:hypothetical protein